MRLPVLLIALLASACSLAGAPLPAGDAAQAGFSPERLERLHRLVQGYIDDRKYAGAITLIARDGRIVDARTYGYRDVAAKIPMERDALIYIYSLTKMAIAVTTLTLFEEGRFSLDDPIAKYLPEFEHMKVITGGTREHPELVDARPITIRHLLTHTSGFAYDFTASPVLKPFYEHNDIFRHATLAEFAQAMARMPLNHQPGDAFTYGASFDVLGYLIEKLTGRPLETAMRERLFAPLAMNDTFFVVPPEKRGRLANVYQHAPDGSFQVTEPMTLVKPATGGKFFASGTGGLISTADDYLRFFQMLLNGGELDGVRVLGPKTVRFMLSDHLTKLKTPTNFMGPAGTYGLGVGLWSDSGAGDSPGSAGRFGWTGAPTTYCNADPREGTIALVFAQHLPYDEYQLFPKFSTTFYQSLITTRAH